MKKSNKSANKNVTLNDKGRRVWDTSNYKQAPKPDQAKVEKKFPVVEERSYLKAHLDGDELNLEKNVGKTIMVTGQTPKDEQGGYYCKTCECVLKDSASYLDHINGKKHNRMLGMNMKVEKVGIDKVKERLLNLKRKVDKPIVTFGINYLIEEDLEKKLEEQEKFEREEKERKKKLKKQQKKHQNVPEDEENGIDNV